VLVVSFHDLHPGSVAECERFLAAARDAGVDRISLLVVPRWHGSTATVHDESFLARLRRWQSEGHEICLHGYVHRVERVTGGPFARLVGTAYTDREGEFHTLGEAASFARIRRGLDLLAGAGLEVEGFAPPAWLAGTPARRALARSGLSYYTTLTRIVPLGGATPIVAPALSLTSRSGSRRSLSRLWAGSILPLFLTARVVRLAAHPVDLGHPESEALLARLTSHMAAERAALTYRDVVRDTAPQSSRAPRRIGAV
jgi:predicted deacetylase